MKKTTRTLVIVSVAMEGNCSVAALWCMVETMAGLGRYRQGAGQVTVRHSLSGAQLSEVSWRGWECWQAHKQHCPPLWCHLLPSSQGENGSGTKWAKKALACSASPGHGKTGRERRQTPFPTTPGTAWGNLALVSHEFPLTAPGTVNLSCYLRLWHKHKQVQCCNFCLNSMLSFCRTLFALKRTTGLWSSELQDGIEAKNLKQRRQRNVAYTDLILLLILPNLYTCIWTAQGD